MEILIYLGGGGEWADGGQVLDDSKVLTGAVVATLTLTVQPLSLQSETKEGRDQCGTNTRCRT